MASTGDTLAKVITELGKMLQPLFDAVASPQALYSFMQKLGWTTSDIPAPLQQMGTATAALITSLEQAVQDDFSLQDILNLKTAIGNVITAVQAIEAAPDAAFPPDLLADNFKSTFPEQVIEYLLADYLLTNQRSLAFILQALGVLKVKYAPAAGNRPAFMQYNFDFSAVPQTLQQPSLALQNAFGWGTPDFDFDGFTKIIDNLMQRWGTEARTDQLDAGVTNRVTGVDILPAFLLNPLVTSLAIVFFQRQRTNGDRMEAGINFIELPQDGAKMPGFAVLPFFNGVANMTMQLDTTISVGIATTLDFDGGIAVMVRPDGVQLLTGFNQADNPSQASAALTVTAAFDPGSADPVLLLGSEDGSRVDFTGLGLSGGVSVSTDGSLEFLSEFQLKGFRIVLSLGGSDSFIKQIISTDPIVAQADLTIGFSSKRGIYFSGSGALELSIPTHIDIGPIEIQNATISIKPAAGGLPIGLGLSVKAALGPLTVVVNNIGITATVLFPPQAKFIDFSLGFKPPDGAGIVVDAGMVTGGGFLAFDADKGQYTGAIELEFEDLFSLKAYGIIQTKMPDGSSGFSLLIVVMADFTPVQLGFGFTLNAVGGLLGLNRSVNTDAIRQGLKTNTLQDALFPADVIGNIAKIITDIAQLFPPEQGHFVVGPMGIIGWGEPSIITLEIGILLEIPNPEIVIPGVIRAFLPTMDEALLKLQVNFVGIIDFDNKLISFDASLYDSKILVYTLTGDMAFRLSWGDSPYFLLSVGGFNPAYKDAPPDLANMTRLTVSLLSGSNPKLTLQCYFAVTSNTVQFGAKAELYAAAGGFNVYGFVGFDCLFQFSPFHFDADFQAGLSLRRGTSTIMGITLSGELSGPAPWEVKGSASISILFFSISVSFDDTWGDPATDAPPQKVDLLGLLTAAIGDDTNWKAALPPASTQYVSLKQIPATAGPIVHPFGVLTFSQRILPLGVDITHFGTQLPQDVNHFTITDGDAPAVTEEFAAANFFDLSDSDKLSRPSYEPMTSGFALQGASDLQTADMVSKDVDYRFSYLRTKKETVIRAGGYSYAKAFFQSNLNASAVSQSKLSFARNRVSVIAPEAVSVVAGGYAVVDTATLGLPDPSLTAGSYSEAAALLTQWVAARPALAGTLQVVADYEVNVNA